MDSQTNKAVIINATSSWTINIQEVALINNIQASKRHNFAETSPIQS